MSDASAEKPKNALERLLASAAFRNTITALILINAAILGLLTYPLPEIVLQVLTFAVHAIIAMNTEE